MKTVRFSRVVAACGRPEVYLQFSPGEKDRALSALAKKARIMTIHPQVRGGRKDFGTVGLLTTPRSQLLVFPRSLGRFAERRVIGVDYALLSGGGAGAAKSTKAAGPGQVRGRTGTGSKRESDGRTKGEVLRFVPAARAVATAEAPPERDELLAKLRIIRKHLRARRAKAALAQLTRLLERIEASREVR